MKLHPILLVIVLAALAVAASFALSSLPTDRRAPPATETRIVSLMPPITETLFDIGAGGLLVGRSDYCNYPPGAAQLPTCGTSLTPNAEAVVRLGPSLILGLDAPSTPTEKLAALGDVRLLPWLSAEDVIASTRGLGRLTGREQAADALADELAAALLVEPPDGPRVLLAMGHTPGRLRDVTFFKHDSLHGRILNAAGGRNAVEFPVTGVPRISLERVLEVDPDLIIVLAFADDLSEAERAQLVTDWRALTPLSAVTEGRVSVLSGGLVVPAGRRTFGLIETLRVEIERLGE